MSTLEAQIRCYVPLSERLLESARPTYVFTNNVAYSELVAKRHFGVANQIYVLEILFRFHAAALVSIHRNLSWMKSMEKTKRASAYFGYCSSLRGFIESAADSFYSLQYAPQNLSEYFHLLFACVGGEKADQMHLFKDLEDWGLHFMEAGKYDDPRKKKEHFKARASWEYLKAIDSESAFQPVYSLYERLCQITHPSRETTYLYFRKNVDHWTVGDVDESAQILQIESSHGPEFEEVFQKSFNSALIVLWIIDQFGIDQLACPFIRGIDLTTIGDFRKAKEKISQTRR